MSFTRQLTFVLMLLVSRQPGPVSAAASLHNDTLHIGYFMTSDPYRAGAINLAIDRAQDEGLLNRNNFRYSYTPIHNNKFYCLPYIHVQACSTKTDRVKSWGNELKKCVLRSFLKRVRSAMSRRVEGRAFHSSGPEKENARSPMDVRHLGSRYDVQSADRVLSGCRWWRKLCRRGTPGRFRDEQTASAIVTCRNHVTLSRDFGHVIESPIVTPQIHKSFSPWTASVVLTSRTPTVFAHLLCWLMFVLHYCYLSVRLSVRLSHWQFTPKMFDVSKYVVHQQ